MLARVIPCRGGLVFGVERNQSTLGLRVIQKKKRNHGRTWETMLCESDLNATGYEASKVDAPKPQNLASVGALRAQTPTSEHRWGEGKARWFRIEPGDVRSGESAIITDRKCVCFGSNPTSPPCVPFRESLVREGAAARDLAQYRGTSLIRNSPPPRNTIGPKA